MEKLYVQFGCGLCAPEGWRNFDASPRLRAEKFPVFGRFIRPPLFPRNCEYGDIVRGLPLSPGTCDVLYSSHVLEHLSLEDLRIALTNVYSLLKPGGVFRSVVPDLEGAAQKYLASEADDRAIEFLKTTSLGKRARARKVIGWAHELLGNASHLWMWDFRGLAAELKKVGFTEIRSAAYGDTDDPMIARVESEGRWIEALGVHCRKPEQQFYEIKCTPFWLKVDV